MIQALSFFIFLCSHNFKKFLWFHVLDSSFRKMSYRVVETMDSDVITEENSASLRLSPAYETAMEALSSLITRKKRGDASNIGGKYKKLDRMLMYIEVTSFSFCSQTNDTLVTS